MLCLARLPNIPGKLPALTRNNHSHSWVAARGATGLQQLVFRPSIGTVNAVNKTVIEVHVRAVLPTTGGCAGFIWKSDETFILLVDQKVGSAITMFIRQMAEER